MNGFEETSAVVTGASSGIGRAIAVALARAGIDRLGIHYCGNRTGADETAKLAQSAGATTTILQCDLVEAPERARMVEEAFQQLGAVQTWVNNAGADVLTGHAAALHFDAKLKRLMDIDVLGTIDMSRMVADRLVDQGSVPPPSIVFIGWDQAPHGMEGDAGQMFGTAKAAIMAFAASLAQTVAPQVRVNTVAPGWIKTSWGESSSEYWDKRARSQSMMNRWGDAEDVAKAVLYAADPSNTFLTGQTIDVNGGWNRRG
jgi:3-oxoacyl-[acyl-carrier protein] reductase